MNNIKDVQMNTLMKEIRESLEKALDEGKLSTPIGKLNPVKWSNEIGDFKFDGEHVYIKPKKPIESIKIDFKINNDGTI